MNEKEKQIRAIIMNSDKPEKELLEYIEELRSRDFVIFAFIIIVSIASLTLMYLLK